MPLVAYVADECHRFVTSGLVHGEQSFLDTCQSFGAFCVLACQSVASLRQALAEANGFSDSTEPAIEIILANSGNELFFRSTDRDVGECVERLCPRTPGHPDVASIRPPRPAFGAVPERGTPSTSVGCAGSDRFGTALAMIG